MSSVTEQKPNRMRITLESEPGVTIGETLYLPGARGTNPALLLMTGRSSESLAESAVAKGNVVLEVEPSDSPAANDNRPYLGKPLRCDGSRIPAALRLSGCAQGHGKANGLVDGPRRLDGPNRPGPRRGIPNRYPDQKDEPYLNEFLQ